MTLAINIVKALGDLQAKDIIHKDIQPENILVNPETLEVKLTGFNYATKIQRQRLSFKNPSMLEGSLPYMSPEQTGRMNREVDYRTDFIRLELLSIEFLRDNCLLKRMTRWSLSIPILQRHLSRPTPLRPKFRFPCLISFLNSCLKRRRTVIAALSAC